MPRRSPLDLGPRARVVFAALFVGAQLILIFSARARAEHAFGFRMFSESTTVELHLWRELRDGRTVRVEHGAWLARDRGGAWQHVAFRDFVDGPELSFFDVRMHAPYGRAAELAREQAALDYVAAHVEDTDTARFVVDAELRRVGRAPEQVRLVSQPVHARR